VPQDVIVPGVLELGDIGAVPDALAPRPVRLEAMVNGKDQLLPENGVRKDIAQPDGKLPASVEIHLGEETSALTRWFHAHL
jgi:hypothetical protein